MKTSIKRFPWSPCFDGSRGGNFRDRADLRISMALSRRVAVVTGASSGMGKAFVKALLTEGLVVYAGARRLDRMADLVQLGAVALKLDITNQDDLEAVAARINEEHGHVDVLINNAGFAMYGAVEDTSLDDARYQFEVNLFGAARLTKLLLPGMRMRRSGTIINIISAGGRIYSLLGAWYHATKHALEGWSDCLRIELAPFNIDVVIIEPGTIATDFGKLVPGPMLERSGSGPYSDAARNVASTFKSAYATGVASDPQVIVGFVLDAIRSKKPKIRYVGGKLAKPALFLRRWLGDRIYDRIVLTATK
jgi:NAD(P)-dependent dehydrogenase (short-subunit alcohol dehydrogenase family)